MGKPAASAAATSRTGTRVPRTTGSEPPSTSGSSTAMTRALLQSPSLGVCLGCVMQEISRDPATDRRRVLVKGPVNIADLDHRESRRFVGTDHVG